MTELVDPEHLVVQIVRSYLDGLDGLDDVSVRAALLLIDPPTLHATLELARRWAPTVGLPEAPLFADLAGLGDLGRDVLVPAIGSAVLALYEVWMLASGEPLPTPEQLDEQRRRMDWGREQTGQPPLPREGTP